MEGELQPAGGQTIGVLDARSDRFTADVVARLADFPVAFLSYSACGVPITGQYGVVIDRLSFRFPYLLEVVKALSLDGTYVVNNPFSAGLTNKLVDMKVCTRLGLPVPKTVVLPRAEGCEETDGAVGPIVWDRLGTDIGFPCILKPYDGYAWEDVYVAGSVDELRSLHEALRHRPILLAQQIIKYRDYYRVFCIDKKDVLFVKWLPKPGAMGEYLLTDLKATEGIGERLAGLTKQLNRALDLDINVVEWCFDQEGQAWVIDAFNEVPDIRPESLPPEYYEWLVDRFAACVRDNAINARRNK